MRVAGIMILLALVSAAVLPGQNRRLIGTLREDLKTQQDKYYQAKVREQRLLEMRIRHDMGLPVRAGRYLEMSEEQANLIRYADPGMLTREEDQTRLLARQLATLQDRLEASTGGLPVQAKGPIALPGVAVTSRPVTRVLSEPVLVSQPEEVAARPAGETWQLSLSVGLNETDGEVHLLKGSPDVATIGRVLLRYGKALLAKSKAFAADGLAEEAGRWRDRAREELQRAKKELDPLIWQQEQGKLSRKYRDDVSLSDMFLLAQCEEKLGNFGQAEELFLQIQGLDRVQDEIGNSVFGEWGLAADAANRVMKFMLEHGQWAPVPSIESLQWQSK